MTHQTNRVKLCSLLVALLLGVNSIEAAPKVIRTIPENGDTNVAAGTVKIRIQFNTDMSSRGHSLVGGGEKFPTIIGEPQWSGKRIFVFTAQLEPNHEYTFSINSSTYTNFKSVQGIPAEPYRVWFKTAGQGGNADANEITPGGHSEDLNKEAIVCLKKAIESSYSYYDLKKVDWDSVFAKYEQKLLKAKTPDEFAKIAGLLLASAKDKHIWLTVDDQKYPSYVNPSAANVNPKLLAKLVDNLTKRSQAVYSGRLSGDIGYVLIDSWSMDSDKEIDILFEILNEFKDTKGLIIDVRGNGGGSETMASKFAGCFIDKPVVYAKHISIDPDSITGFSETQERILKPTPNAPHYRSPVAVLVGPAVMSSCEAFVLMMKQVAGCKIIGLPTQGSSGNPKPHELGNGVTVFLPSWKAMLPDGTCFEGRGIKPDILVNGKFDNSSAQDSVLNAAINELKKNEKM